MPITFTVPPCDDEIMQWLIEHDLDPTENDIRLDVTIDDDGSVHLLRDLVDEAGVAILTDDSKDIASEPVVIANPKRPFPWPP